MSVRVAFFLSLQWLMILFPAFTQSRSAVILNPSFEEVDEGRPAGWSVSAWDYQKAAGEYLAVEGPARTGSYYAALICHTDNDVRFEQVVEVSAASSYKLSCWVQTRNVGDQGIGANLSVRDQITISRQVKGTTTDWEQLILYVKTGPQTTAITVTLGLGGYAAVNSGEVRFDDIAIEPTDIIPGDAPVAELGPPVQEKPAHAAQDTAIRSFKWQKPSLYLLILTGLLLLMAGGAAAYYLLAVRQQGKEERTGTD